MRKKTTIKITDNKKKLFGFLSIFILIAWLITMFGEKLNKVLDYPIAEAAAAKVAEVAADLVNIGVGLMLVLTAWLLWPVMLKVVTVTIAVIGAIMIYNTVKDWFGNDTMSGSTNQNG